ncbi:hypothetical protein FACS189463_2540 [Bacteroidia bacterium]|nr:hypothetical protein FACS189463_2540 [Bacteroidia bacterium]
MAEIYDKNVNPEAAFTYSRILYTERTPAPSFIHGLSQPMLIPGMRYAWRVRAIAKQGIEETSVIKNDGFSQVFWFDYTADCNTVTTLGALYENNKVNITWQDVNAMNYTVEYRKKGSSKWYTGEITQPELCTVYNLKNGTEYEYRVGSRCVINDAYQYSDIKGIKIPRKEDLQQERQRNCGIMPDTKITNKTPIEQLIPGQPVLAGDFPVFISKVTGSGRFSGEGYVGIPYIGNLKVAVTFKDIVVNTDSRLISGYFETKYDAVNNMTVDIDQALTGGKGVGDVRTGEEKAAYTVDYNINPDIKVLPVKVDGTKDEIAESSNYTLTKGENDKYVFIITDAEGKEHQMEIEDIPATITDQSGNSFTVNATGTITNITNSGTSTANNTQNIASQLKAYYLVEGNKFYSGEAIYLPFSNKKYEIKAYRDSVNLFPHSTVWSGVANVDSATVHFMPNVISTNINGITISTIYSDSLRNDTLQCNIVVVNVEFEEDPTQKWGFDENNPPKEDLYTSYQVYNNKGIPWKSLNKDGSPDIVQVVVQPHGAENKVALFTSNSLIIVDSLTSSRGSVNLSSRIANGYIGAKIDNFVNDSMRLNIAAYDLKIVDVKIVNIDEENDDVQLVNYGDTTINSNIPIVTWGINRFLDSRPGGDDQVVFRPNFRDSVIIAGPNKICDTKANNTNIVSTNLSLSSFETTINNLYKQAVVQVNITYDPIHKVVNYDLNKDSMINSSTKNELQEIYNYIVRTEGNTICLCLIDYPSSNNSNGMFGFSDRAGVFYYKKMNGTTPSNIYKTAAHELGHGVFKLDHPFHDVRIPFYPRRPVSGGWVAKDINTIMEWDGGWPRDKVRKYHWDDLRSESSNPNTH